jgi:Mg2+ and Co2+ transporter CorA
MSKQSEKLETAIKTIEESLLWFKVELEKRSTQKFLSDNFLVHPSCFANMRAGRQKPSAEKLLEYIKFIEETR